MSLSLLSFPEPVAHCGNEISVKIHTSLSLSTPNLKIKCFLSVEMTYYGGTYTVWANQVLDPDSKPTQTISMGTSDNFIKVRYATEDEYELVSCKDAKRQGLDMVHNRYALAWDHDDEGWFVLVPEETADQIP